MEVRNKYRLCFAKYGAMRYIGHLDLLKLFQRTIKRGRLPISYSSGFNPHQQMSFALPLPIGYTSSAEYVDIELDRSLPPEDIVSTLNAHTPAGLDIISARALIPGERSAAAVTAAAAYEIYLPEPIPGISGYISEILAANEIIMTKKTKSGSAPANIRPDIFSLISPAQQRIDTVLAAGSGRNLKPGLLVEHIYNLADIEYAPLAVKYKRTGLMRETQKGFAGLGVTV